MLVNGSAGMVITMAGKPLTVVSFAVVDDKITEIDAISDPARVAAFTSAL